MNSALLTICYQFLLFLLIVPKFKTNQMYTQNYSKNPRPKCKSNKCFQIISNVKNPMKMTYIVIVRHKKMNNKFVYFWKLLPNHQRSSRKFQAVLDETAQFVAH
jgi:hypothetical protein